MSFYIVCTRKGVISNNTVYSQKCGLTKCSVSKCLDPLKTNWWFQYCALINIFTTHNYYKHCQTFHRGCDHSKSAIAQNNYWSKLFISSHCDLIACQLRWSQKLSFLLEKQRIFYVDKRFTYSYIQVFVFITGMWLVH